MKKKRIIEFIIAIVIGIIVCSIVILIGINTPDRSRRKSCASNVKQIALALCMYLNDNGDRFPDAQESFMNLYPKYNSSPTLFWCPTDANNKKPPDTINNWKIDGENSSQISYMYIPGFTSKDKNVVILKDNTPKNHEGKGVYAVFGDGHIQWVIEPAKEGKSGATP
jgi:hypothetical protein